MSRQICNQLINELYINNGHHMVVYHLRQKPIWFQTVQMERKNFDWKFPFEARAFHFP